MLTRDNPSQWLMLLLLISPVALFPLTGHAIGVSPTSLTFQSHQPDQASLMILGDTQDSTAINLWVLKREAGENMEHRQIYEGDAIDIFPPQLIVEEGESYTVTITWNSMAVATTSLSFYVVIETLPVALEDNWKENDSDVIVTTRIHVPLHVNLPEEERTISITSSYSASRECIAVKNTGNHYMALSDLALNTMLPDQSQPVVIHGREIANSLQTDALIPGAEYCLHLKK